MQLPHPGILVLVLGCTAIDILAAVAVRHERTWPSDCLSWGLVLSQNGLLWLWAALGSARFFARFTVPGVVLLVFTAIRGSDSSGDRQFEIVLLFGGAAVVLLTVLIPLRFVGRWLVWRPEDGLPRAERVQFSLWSLMETTTGVAVLAALSKLVLAPSHMPLGNLTFIVILSPALAAILLLMTWILMRNRLNTRLVRVVVVISVAMAVLTSAFTSDGGGRGNRTIQVVLTYAALLAGCLIVCRLCGYRIVRTERRRTDCAMSPIACD
jgi:hypothetical protein